MSEPECQNAVYPPELKRELNPSPESAQQTLKQSDMGATSMPSSAISVQQAFMRYTNLTWNVITRMSQKLFRVLGLNILVCWIRSLSNFKSKKKSGLELPKVAIQKNRASALLRALIHAVPIGVALWVISINLYGLSVGVSVKPLTYYQVGAKVHEIAVQASLAVVLFSYIRHEMVLGRGLPLGSMFCALQVSQPSYLWSTEFWGSIASKNLAWRRKCRLIAFVFFSIVLAAVIGPSTAILLVPRLDYWSAGSTHIWMNITADDLWPTRYVGIKPSMKSILTLTVRLMSLYHLVA